jgi:hypothetical protein
MIISLQEEDFGLSRFPWQSLMWFTEISWLMAVVGGLAQQKAHMVNWRLQEREHITICN